MGTIPIKVGQKIKRLTCLEIEANTRGANGRHALFRCECGTQKIIRISHVVTGRTISCGCFKAEESNTRFFKHGDRHTRLYRTYTHMKSRCYDSNSKDYYNYGARGITVCNKWKNSYIEFKIWALKHGYKDNLSIDRINGNEGYSPSNCRWADSVQQSRNLRTNIKYKGEIAADASMRLGGNKMLVACRVLRGWSIEKAFTSPVIKST